MPSLSKKIFKSFLQTFTGSGIGFITSLVSGYFFALILGPAIYGIWQTAKVFLSYGSFTSLGIPFAMRRDFITLRAEGKTEESEKLAHVAITYNLIINPIIAVVFIAIAVFTKSETAFKLSLLLVGLMYITDLFSGLGQILNKGVNDYKTIGNGNIIYGIGTLLIIPFVFYFGYNALLVGYLAVSIIKSYYFYTKRPINYKWVWDFPVLKKMIFVGFPLFLVTLTSTLFISIDRVLIAGLIDFKNVGFYSLSTFLAQPITLFLSSFSVVIFTQLNEKYGKSKEAHIIEKQTYIPQKLFSYILPPIIGMGVVVLPMLTELFLPQYKQGITAAQISIFAILFLHLAGFSSNGLFILDKHLFTALSFFIAGCIKTTGSYFALKAGYGIESVALFSLLAYFFYNSLMLYFINKSLGNSISTFFKRLHENLLCPLTILVFCFLYVQNYNAIFQFFAIENPWLQMLLGLLLVCIISGGFIYKAILDIRTFLSKLVFVFFSNSN
jgi:O-antigen/teichoic acid export membrane protein